MNNRSEIETKDDIRATVYIPKSLHKQMKLFAVQNDTSVSEIVREAVTQYFSQRSKKAAKAKAKTSTSP
jgi:hypothetical protein